MLFQVISLHVSRIYQLRIFSLSLLAALATAGCTSTTLPKLADLTGAEAQPKAEVSSGTSAVGSPVPMPPAAGVTGPASAPAPYELADGHAVRAPGGRAMIVGFKAPTVVLFAEEFGNEGERVATSSLVLPLQMKNAPSNAGRVQIETAYGTRWIARGEIVLGASDGQRIGRPVQ